MLSILRSKSAKLQEEIRSKTKKRKLRNTTNIMQGGPQWLETYTICNYISSYFQQRSHFESNKYVLSKNSLIKRP